MNENQSKERKSKFSKLYQEETPEDKLKSAFLSIVIDKLKIDLKIITDIYTSDRSITIETKGNNKTIIKIVR